MYEPSNWGRWGSGDEQGAKNLLTEAAVLRACTVPTQGRVYNLGIELRRGLRSHRQHTGCSAISTDTLTAAPGPTS